MRPTDLHLWFVLIYWMHFNLQDKLIMWPVCAVVTVCCFSIKTSVVVHVLLWEYFPSVTDDFQVKCNLQRHQSGRGVPDRNGLCDTRWPGCTGVKSSCWTVEQQSNPRRAVPRHAAPHMTGSRQLWCLWLSSFHYSFILNCDMLVICSVIPHDFRPLWSPHF